MISVIRAVVKNQQLHGEVPRQKGKKTIEFSKAGPARPAIQPALLRGALLDCGRHFESNTHILMSGEELVSQNSLKYDHM